MLTRIAKRNRSQANDSFGVQSSMVTQETERSKRTTVDIEEAMGAQPHAVDYGRMSSDRRRWSREESITFSYP